MRRCAWCGDDELYCAYHDHEWGLPVGDDRRLFEKLCLEGFQCGLSWLTVLRKRPRFREVFHHFEPEAVAAMTARDVRRLLGDAGIIRHRGKVESTINNARRALEAAETHGSLAAWLWSFAPPPPAGAGPRTPKEIASTSPAATALSRELKRAGWSFVGPTTVHAFMQAVGMVNDHVATCAFRAPALDARRRFDERGGAPGTGANPIIVRPARRRARR